MNWIQTCSQMEIPEIPEASSRGKYVEEGKDGERFQQVTFACRGEFTPPTFYKDVSEKDLRCTWDSNPWLCKDGVNSELNFAKESTVQWDSNIHCSIQCQSNAPKLP